MMRRLVTTFSLGVILMGLNMLPAAAEDEVAALVIDNGTTSLPEAPTLTLFTIGISAVAALGLYRRRQARKSRKDDER